MIKQIPPESSDIHSPERLNESVKPLGQGVGQPIQGPTGEIEHSSDQPAARRSVPGDSNQMNARIEATPDNIGVAKIKVVGVGGGGSLAHLRLVSRRFR